MFRPDVPVHPSVAATIGPTLAQSQPAWQVPQRPRTGAPNVVVILLDDMGFSDLACFGGEIHTPHIDQLAQAGARFTGYTTVPMCTPARAALLTGKNPHSVGCGWLTHNDPGYPGYRGEMSPDAPTMAELLRAEGYSCYAVGKWHNTYDLNAQPGGDTASWPLQRGFDRFYGFMGAETSYFHPDRMMEGNQPGPQHVFAPGYFAPDDYTERGLQWLREHSSCAPDKPFFLYLSLQTPHTPLQAKAQDLSRYRGCYDAGWDEIRAQRFARQRSAGVVEPQAVLSPRNPGVPAWGDLSEAQKTLLARHMEVYAALLDNADQNVGKLMATLRDLGAMDNTLLILTSDNGANAVGGPAGSLNLHGRRSGQVEDPSVVEHILSSGLLGSEATYSAYPAGWAQVSNTPYRYYKRTPMAGGIRVPFIVHWPQGLKDAGSVRRQWIHVTDVLPTLLDVLQVDYPSTFQGLRTRGLDGTSFLKLLASADAPHPRVQQHYELQANRAFIQWPWKIVSLQAPNQALQLDNWMLFNLSEDPCEIHDLATSHQQQLQSLVQAFEKEATVNYVYPLDNRDDTRAITLPPHALARASEPRLFYPGPAWIPPALVSPLLADRTFDVQLSFEWQTGQEGVLFSLGDRFAGVAAFVMAGALHFVYQRWFSPIELAPMPLKPGHQDLHWHFEALGQRQGHSDLSLNGQAWVTGVNMSPTLVRIPSGGLTVGMSRRQSVSERYASLGTFNYTGIVRQLRIVPGPQAPDSPMEIDEAKIQNRLRLERPQA